MDGWNIEWTLAYLGLGSNLGDRGQWLADAVRLLGQEPGIRVEACSAVYETDPVGYVEQPAFLNMAVRIATLLPPLDLLAVMLRIELELGRKREIRWGPRTIDIDMLLYGNLEMDTPELTVPHPRMLERAFVLIPLRDIYPGDALPGAVGLSERLDILEGKEGVKLWTNKR
ncbi:2-amino-4-hydroxy-6-hydroxymethyldihydropteridine diphosphokinase [Gorillibacterium sp. sgz5001074]|uniref:2-amino-4-hydroxy-6- hydroxymethyldihydropteridine diphosphokinase n=1 Tax=Gorillibacterium sp. sgz5001074 TaxID=3446695 RepID=UPI003F676DE1